jgi:phosphosulfolactate synthase (CoM biosynthesis protein A)
MNAPFDLPGRSAKPRVTGLTHVLDKGLSVREVDDLVEVCGDFIDIVKLGWGTSVVTGNLEAKLGRYRAHDIPVVLGGTLTEIALRDGRMDDLIEWMKQLGLDRVEISDGTIDLEPSRKLALIERLAGEGFSSDSPERASRCSLRWDPRTPRRSWRPTAGWSSSRPSWRPAPGRWSPRRARRAPLGSIAPTVRCGWA